MKKILLSLFLVFTVFSTSANAQMDPRVKALGTMALYGTVGGALLGTAALAFDADGRAVAVGASLGLYAGLIFGGYVVGSHVMKKRKIRNQRYEDNYYPDTDDSPYQDQEGDGYDEDQSMYQDGYQTKLEIEKPGPANFRFSKKPIGQTYYVNLLNYRF